jgi:hypothetical protein
VDWDEAVVADDERSCAGSDRRSELEDDKLEDCESCRASYAGCLAGLVE